MALTPHATRAKISVLAGDWCQGYLNKWHERLGASQSYLDAVFAHKVPFQFIEFARDRGLKEFAFSGAYAAYLRLNGSAPVSLDAFELRMGEWVDSSVANKTLIDNILRSSPAASMYCKGAALGIYSPQPHRFAVDIDIELDTIESCVDIISRLSSHGFQPYGALRYRVESMPFLHFTMQTTIGRQMVFVDASAGFIEGFPSGYGSMTMHPYVGDSFQRSRRRPGESHIRVPGPNDWIIRLLVEVTSNGCIRLRDIIDLSHFLADNGQLVAWPRFASDISEFGLEPYWTACLLCMQDAGMDDLLDAISPCARSYKHKGLAAGLLPTPSARHSLMSMASAYRFLLKLNTRRFGRFCAARMVICSITGRIIRAINKTLHLNLFGDGVISRLLIPSEYSEITLDRWNLSDIDAIRLQ